MQAVAVSSGKLEEPMQSVAVKRITYLQSIAISVES
jgi:hypothetical protein